jgi:CRP-like cAMP-binding protein
MRKVLYIFGKLADRDIYWLIANGEKEEWAGGSVLIRKGSPQEDLHQPERQPVRLPRRRRKKIAELGAGEFVGEMSFVDSSPTSATVIADGPVTVYSIARGRLVAHIEEDDGFGARFYHAIAIFLADRLRHTIGIHDYDELSEEERESLDELDALITDTVSLAGERFQRMLHTMLERRTSPSTDA